jgi:hypothetical protein
MIMPSQESGKFWRLKQEPGQNNQPDNGAVVKIFVTIQSRDQKPCVGRINIAHPANAVDARCLSTLQNKPITSSE